MYTQFSCITDKIVKFWFTIFTWFKSEYIVLDNGHSHVHEFYRTKLTLYVKSLNFFYVAKKYLHFNKELYDFAKAVNFLRRDSYCGKYYIQDY